MSLINSKLCKVEINYAIFFSIISGNTINFHVFSLHPDSKGNPRCITNSKGKKRRVGSKDLQQAVKTSDANFLDFIRRCLE